MHDGALHLEVVKQDWDTRQVSATATPQIAHYQGVQVDSREPILAPGQRVLFGVATDLNFRPAFWTSAPQAGDDGELDFEFFSNNDSLTYTQIWDYSPFTQHQLNVPTPPNPANVHEYGIIAASTASSSGPSTASQQFRSPQRMSNNPHRSASRTASADAGTAATGATPGAVAASTLLCGRWRRSAGSSCSGRCELAHDSRSWVRMAAMAFDARGNPQGAAAYGDFANDIGHWDVPDFFADTAVQSAVAAALREPRRPARLRR